MTTKSDTADKAAPGPKTSWNGAFSPEIIAQEGRASLDSVVEASTIAIKGYGAIGGAWFDFAKEAHGGPGRRGRGHHGRTQPGPSSPMPSPRRRRARSSAPWLRGTCTSPT